MEVGEEIGKIKKCEYMLLRETRISLDFFNGGGGQLGNAFFYLHCSFTNHLYNIFE